MRCVVANWKMNHLYADASNFCSEFAKNYTPMEDVRVAIAPPTVLLWTIHSQLRERGITTFAQNGYFEPNGAFTGEMSMAQIRDAGCSGVILGHSERRQLFGETNEALAKKVHAAQGHKLLPLLCIGETMAEREREQTFSVIQTQLSVLKGASRGPIWVAYEPVWAIGTGRIADGRQIREAHAFIREELRVILGEPGASVPILYGGSVTPQNFAQILTVPEVSGALVGGASLDPVAFAQMVNIAQS